MCQFCLFLIFSTMIRFTLAVYTLNELGSSLELNALPDQRQKGHCVSSDSSGFVCDLSNGTICSFAGTNDNQWFSASGQVDQAIWSQSVNTQITPGPPSAAVQLFEVSPIGVIESDVIPCLKNEAKLMFMFWSTDNVNLVVCLITQTTKHEICSEIFNQTSASYPGPLSFAVHRNINETFIIQYVVSLTGGSTQGFAFLDELAYFGQDCDTPPRCLENNTSTSVESSTFTSQVQTFPANSTYLSTNATTQFQIIVVRNSTELSSIGTTGSSIVSSSDCSGLVCNFAKGWCGYGNFRSSSVDWTRQNIQLGRPLSRISEIRLDSGTSYYLGAILRPNDKDIAALQSTKFAPKSRTLKFKYFRAIYGTVIAICQETIESISGQQKIRYTTAFQMKECPVVSKELTGANAFIWNSVTVSLSADTYMFYVVAYQPDQSAGDAGVGVDDFQIEDC